MALDQFPPDLVPVRTADGSHTLDSRALKEHYHSLHGAAAESRHVYIANGLLATGRQELRILEIGLGTGLNVLLTWIECGRRGWKADYVALEPFPLPERLWSALGHPAALGALGRQNGYDAMMRARAGEQILPGDGFTFRWERGIVQHIRYVEELDLVYYDAFSPAVQPDMWTKAVFDGLCRAMRSGARLVTYCAKGSVRRAMMEAGLEVQQLPGAPGKRQMTGVQRQ